MEAVRKASQEEDRIVRAKEAAYLMGTSIPSIHRWVQQGLFPRPVKIVKGVRAAGWKLSTIRKLMAEAEPEEIGMESVQ